MKVAIKHCGTCNPHTDVGWIAKTIRHRLERDGFELASADAGDLDALILISGCPRACVDRPEIRRLAPISILVAGETVDYSPVSERDIPWMVELALRASTPTPS